MRTCSKISALIACAFIAQALGCSGDPVGGTGGEDAGNGGSDVDFDIDSSGQRFLMFQGEGDVTKPDTLTFITNWFQELRATFEVDR